MGGDGVESVPLLPIGCAHCVALAPSEAITFPFVCCLGPYGQRAFSTVRDFLFVLLLLLTPLSLLVCLLELVECSFVFHCFASSLCCFPHCALAFCSFCFLISFTFLLSLTLLRAALRTRSAGWVASRAHPAVGGWGPALVARAVGSGWDRGWFSFLALSNAHGLAGFPECSVRSRNVLVVLGWFCGFGFWVARWERWVVGHSSFASAQFFGTRNGILQP